MNRHGIWIEAVGLAIIIVVVIAKGSYDLLRLPEAKFTVISVLPAESKLKSIPGILDKIINGNVQYY